MAKEKIPGCPHHPELKFSSGPERGGHMRQQHPDWKSDAALNPQHPEFKNGNGKAKPAIPQGRILKATVETASVHGLIGHHRHGVEEPLIAVDADNLQAADLSNTVVRTADQMKQLASAYRAYAQKMAVRANEVDEDAKKLLEKHGK